ncbi:uncharacterized protein LOC117921122 [Vitis riparia]|uniref:uncharacterized protein LOC117921122 n=1 Tax=Vitis riparia TaxID=96939 RepID=UPI00155A3FA4|nr:uncharacterized protein LOC117921122 [Vitis riparia]
MGKKHIQLSTPSPLHASQALRLTPPTAMATTHKKHLSAFANDLLSTSALKLGTSVDRLVEEFEAGWQPETTDYSRKLVEFCSSKALNELCSKVLSDGSLSRFTFNMMLAWEMPDSADEDSHTECVAKEKEERKRPPKETEEQDEIPLFYSDLMPLLVDNKPSIGEDAFAWLGSLFPLVADVVNGRFTFETLTAPTGNRLHFPAYDKFLKEIDKCIKHLQKQATPKGVELADDEFILHVEGTASTQRVVRHIGGASWPGRLTITNYALYFEAMGVLSYEDAFKIDLSKDIDHHVKSGATGPWGAPLFDKAIVYESPELSESVILEFPEITSSTRREHWLALSKEVMLLHQFLNKFKIESPIQAWEMHSRTILGIIRLHAAREMLRISPPDPTKFLIFALFDELPKGDYVLGELAKSLKNANSGRLCSASSILRSLNVSQQSIAVAEVKEESAGESESASASGHAEKFSTLESAINQAREEEEETVIAKATTEGLKEEGIGDNVLVLREQLRPLMNVLPWFQEIVQWKRPAVTLLVITMTLVIIYKEWFHQAIAAFLLWIVAKMLRARQENVRDKHNKIVVSKASDQTTIESIVSAQHGFITVQDIVKTANIAILKIQSILVSRTNKHANTVMMVMVGLAILVAVVPLKFIFMATTTFYFTTTSKLGKYIANDKGNRRLKEWWDSIPVVPVEIED